MKNLLKTYSKIQIFPLPDKSLGDTSDIISDSSGVGTNSDSAACSIGHPSTTVVCMQAYSPSVASTQNNGHLAIQPGDVIEVVGSTDCGLLEGFVRGTSQTGFFPATCVQEVQFRQKAITNVAIADSAQYASTNTLILQNDELQQQFEHLQLQQQQLLMDSNGNSNLSLSVVAQHKVSTLTPTDKKRWVLLWSDCLSAGLFITFLCDFQRK